MKNIIILMLFCSTTLLTTTASADNLDMSLYPFGGTFHRKVTEKSNDGNLNYLAISKSFKKGKFEFENGAGTFIDTFHRRSYLVFTNIIHDDYKLGMVAPILNLHCSFKAHAHKDTTRSFRCYPALKLRIGKDNGLFVNITPVPRIKDLTLGQVAFEIGYKF